MFFLNYFYTASAQSELVEFKWFGSNPGNLAAFAYTPKIAKDSLANKPLVVVLHGCSQSAETVAREAGWNKLADKYGFYVVYPQQKMLNNPSHCFNWFYQNDILRGRGEVASIKQMIDYALKEFKVDSSKIFVYGLSAGAAMSVALMADYPHLINAGAVLAGGPFMSALSPVGSMATMISPKDKSPKEWGVLVKTQNPNYMGHYPRMIVVQGKNDKIVNPRNATELIKQWSYLHQTDDVADSTIASFQANADITKKYYNDSLGNEAIIFYDINNLGHALVIDPGENPEQGGQTGMFAVDKDFYSTYWIAVDFGLIKYARKND